MFRNLRHRSTLVLFALRYSPILKSFISLRNFIPGLRSLKNYFIISFALIGGFLYTYFITFYFPSSSNFFFSSFSRRINNVFFKKHQLNIKRVLLKIEFYYRLRKSSISGWLSFVRYRFTSRYTSMLHFFLLPS